jgi:hypothetical protein
MVEALQDAAGIVMAAHPAERELPDALAPELRQDAFQ